MKNSRKDLGLSGLKPMLGGDIHANAVKEVDADELENGGATTY